MFHILPPGNPPFAVRLSACPLSPVFILSIRPATQTQCTLQTLKSVHRELKISPNSEGHTCRENGLPRRVCPVIAERKLLLIVMDSSVDVLVIGAGPTGLGAAKRLNQLVRKCPYISAGIDLTPHAERALMDDC